MPEYTHQQVFWMEEDGLHRARIVFHIRNGATSSVWKALEDTAEGGQLEWVVKIPFDGVARVLDVSGRPFAAERQVVEDLRNEYRNRQGRRAPLPAMHSAWMGTESPSEAPSSGLLVMPYYAVEHQAIVARNQPGFLQDHFIEFALGSAELFETCLDIGYRNTDVKDENFLWLPDQGLVVLDWNRCVQIVGSEMPAADRKEMERLLVQVFHLIRTGKEVPRPLPLSVDPSWAEDLPRPFRRIVWDASQPSVKPDLHLLVSRLQWWQTCAAWTAENIDEAFSVLDGLREQAETDGEALQRLLDAIECLNSIQNLGDEQKDRLQLDLEWARGQISSPQQQMERVIRETKQSMLDLYFDNACKHCEDFLLPQTEQIWLPAEKLWQLGKYYLMARQLKELAEHGKLTIISGGKDKTSSLVSFWEFADLSQEIDDEVRQAAVETQDKIQRITRWIEDVKAFNASSADEQLAKWTEISKEKEACFIDLPAAIAVFLERLFPAWEKEIMENEIRRRRQAEEQAEKIKTAKQNCIQLLNDSHTADQITTVLQNDHTGDDEEWMLFSRAIKACEALQWKEALSICGNARTEFMQTVSKFIVNQFQTWIADRNDQVLYRSDYEYFRDLLAQVDGIENLSLGDIKTRLALFENNPADPDNAFLEDCQKHKVEPYLWDVQDTEGQSVDRRLNVQNTLLQVGRAESELSQMEKNMETSLKRLEELQESSERIIETLKSKQEEAENLAAMLSGELQKAEEKDGEVQKEQRQLEGKIQTIQQSLDENIRKAQQSLDEKIPAIELRLESANREWLLKIGRLQQKLTEMNGFGYDPRYAELETQHKKLSDQIEGFEKLRTELQNAIEKLSGTQQALAADMNSARVLDVVMQLIFMDQWPEAGRLIKLTPPGEYTTILARFNQHLEELQSHPDRQELYRNWIRALQAPSDQNSHSMADEALTNLAMDVGKILYERLRSMHGYLFDQRSDYDHKHYASLMAERPDRLKEELDKAPVTFVQAYWIEKWQQFDLARRLIPIWDPSNRYHLIVKSMIPAEIWQSADKYLNRHQPGKNDL